jgi:hypothetical protein
MYADDSLFTLTPYGRLGLLAVSAVLVLGLMSLAALFMRGRRGAVRLAVAAFLFSIFVWLSPQVYYGYYQVILDGLPSQWVIGSPPALHDLLGLISFTGPATISAHALGALFWVLVWQAWRFRNWVSAAPGPGR